MEGAHISVKFHADKMRTISYDFDSIIMLEEWMHDEQKEQNLKKPELVFENLKMRHLKKLLWFGLISEDPDLKFSDVGKLVTAWIDNGNYLQDLGLIITKSIENCSLFKKKKELTGVKTEKKAKRLKT